MPDIPLKLTVAYDFKFPDKIHWNGRVSAGKSKIYDGKRVGDTLGLNSIKVMTEV